MKMSCFLFVTYCMFLTLNAFPQLKIDESTPNFFFRSFLRKLIDNSERKAYIQHETGSDGAFTYTLYLDNVASGTLTSPFDVFLSPKDLIKVKCVEECDTDSTTGEEYCDCYYNLNLEFSQSLEPIQYLISDDKGVDYLKVGVIYSPPITPYECEFEYFMANKVAVHTTTIIEHKNTVLCPAVPNDRCYNTDYKTQWTRGWYTCVPATFKNTGCLRVSKSLEFTYDEQSMNKYECSKSGKVFNYVFVASTNSSINVYSTKEESNSVPYVQAILIRKDSPSEFVFSMNTAGKLYFDLDYRSEYGLCSGNRFGALTGNGIPTNYLCPAGTYFQVGGIQEQWCETPNGNDYKDIIAPQYNYVVELNNRCSGLEETTRRWFNVLKHNSEWVQGSDGWFPTTDLLLYETMDIVMSIKVYEKLRIIRGFQHPTFRLIGCKLCLSCFISSYCDIEVKDVRRPAYYYLVGSDFEAVTLNVHSDGLYRVSVVSYAEVSVANVDVLYAGEAVTTITSDNITQTVGSEQEKILVNYAVGGSTSSFSGAPGYTSNANFCGKGYWLCAMLGVLGFVFLGLSAFLTYRYFTIKTKVKRGRNNKNAKR